MTINRCQRSRGMQCNPRKLHPNPAKIWVQILSCCQHCVSRKLSRSFFYDCFKHTIRFFVFVFSSITINAQTGMIVYSNIGLYLIKCNSKQCYRMQIDAHSKKSRTRFRQFRKLSEKFGNLVDYFIHLSWLWLGNCHPMLHTFIQFLNNIKWLHHRLHCIFAQLLQRRINGHGFVNITQNIVFGIVIIAVFLICIANFIK
mmetsp:Transcript_2959/g.4110  ORF Transcript_2959/g.4110 Transcript_2959/m.4110 type:complete len:200 (-) Transcript_2959:448-1047(-)